MSEKRITLSMSNGAVVAYTSDEQSIDWTVSTVKEIWAGDKERSQLSVTGKPTMHVNLAEVVSMSVEDVS